MNDLESYVVVMAPSIDLNEQKLKCQTDNEVSEGGEL